jgi:hypothetical protein
MFAVRELRALRKKLGNGKGGSGAKAGGYSPKAGRLSDVTSPAANSAKVSTHRSGCSDDFKKFVEYEPDDGKRAKEEDDVVAFESSMRPSSGDYSRSADFSQSEWAKSGEGDSQGSLQF